MLMEDMANDRSLEADLLYAIGYFAPVEYHKLGRTLEDWRGTRIDWDKYEQARKNLAELDLIVAPSIGDRNHRLTKRMASTGTT